MVRIATAKKSMLAERLELTGSIEPTRVARMASPVEGPVIACLVREGDHVRAGQLLTKLGHTRGDGATAASARAELKREKLELKRIEKLVRAGALAGEQLDQARIRVSKAKATLARASEKLGDYRIVAPWRGVVSRVHVTVGDFVAARAPLIELFDPASLVLRFAVPEHRAAAVRTGATISLTLDAHPGKTFTAEVMRIYPEIDRLSHTRIVEGTLNEEAIIVPGMFARLEVTLAKVPNAVAIPRPAVLRRGNANVIFVLTPDDRVERRLLETGIEDRGSIQVIEGVELGEQVAVAGHTRLRDGMKVRLARKAGTNEGKRKPATVRPPTNSARAGATPTGLSNTTASATGWRDADTR